MTGLFCVFTPVRVAHLRRLEEYGSLRELVDALPEGAVELAELGSMFESVGLGEDSVRALLRMGDPKAAIDSCIRLNHWERCVMAGLPLCCERYSGYCRSCLAVTPFLLTLDRARSAALTWAGSLSETLLLLPGTSRTKVLK